MWFYKCVFFLNFTFEVQAGLLLLLEQFSNYIALLFYMSIVTDPNISAYWSKSSLFCGLWGKHFMSQSQYEQINCLKKITA